MWNPMWNYGRTSSVGPYGLPLSFPDIGGTKSVEGEFLPWLPKAKTH